MIIRRDHLKQLNILEWYGPEEAMVSSLAFHSQQVKENTAFFCIRGENFDGHAYIGDALNSGASMIIGSAPLLLKQWQGKAPSVIFVVLEEVRSAMAVAAKVFYNHADQELKTIGVTGTNGKTTVAAYVRSLLTLLGMRTGSIGTTGIWTSRGKLEYKKSTPTTPESIDLHRIFRDLRNEADEAAVMEVSSIALDQCRVEGIVFDVAIHTNFSEEHLEYHHTLEHYKACKLRLFRQADHTVVNVDDEGMSKDLLEMDGKHRLTYSITGAEADIRASELERMQEGSRFRLSFQEMSETVTVPVYGSYNVANVLSAIAAAIHLGYEFPAILRVLPLLEGPEGRFQVIPIEDGPTIILDYAHTPVALDRLLEEVKNLEHRRLIVMIAGIGIRDFSKMPKMAATIDGRADEIVVTVDHPGYHDPAAIVDQVMTGFSNPEAVHIHRTNTREAGVRKSLSLAESGDIVLLTSGCINNAQIVRGEEIPHSDEAIIEEFYASVLR